MKPGSAPFLGLALFVAVAPGCGGGGSHHAAGGGAGGGGGGFGTGTGGSSGAGVLTLVSHTPAADATNVSAYAPIELVFSAALDPSSISADSVKLSAAGVPFGATVQLAADGVTLDVTPSSRPAMPATVSVDAASTIAGLDGSHFAGATWSYALPLWQTLGSNVAAAPSSRFGMTFGADGEPVVVWRAGSQASVQVARWNGSRWQTLGGQITSGSTLSSAWPAIAVNASGEVVVVYQTDASTIDARKWDGTTWTALSAGFPQTGTSPAIVADGTGALVVAWRGAAGGVLVERIAGATATPIGVSLDLGTATSFGFALAAGDPVVAHYDSSGDVRVDRWSGSAWSAVSDVIDRKTTSTSGAPSVAVSSDETFTLAFDDADAYTSNGYVYQAQSLGAWQRLGPALDVDLEASVVGPRVAVAADGTPYAAWIEERWGTRRAFVARYVRTAWQVLGNAIDADGSNVASLSVGVDGRGNPTAIFDQGNQVRALRFNGSPTLPFGFTQRPSGAACVIPQDTSASFPLTLTDTGCYADVATKTPIDAFVPFEINTPLWSDGAVKRRFMLLPEGAHLTYTPEGALGVPVGTILLKEFLLESKPGDGHLTIMETRFLVKRCEEEVCASPWQGYSYQWNDAQTEAVLLTGTATDYKDWDVTGATGLITPHRHTYPARTDCVRCHNPSVGRVLGIQTPQLNRTGQYGGTFDNQLRAMNAAGMFGTTFPQAEADALARLPSPNDIGFSLTERARAYFHSNCSHCHNRNQLAEQPVIDFRYTASLATDNICNKLVPGNPSQSAIYIKDSTRAPDVPSVGGDQMPPIATLLKDNRQLAITSAWIQSLTSCP